MHNSIVEIKALSQATSNSVFDTDVIDHPHLFVQRTYTDDEMGSYDDKVTNCAEPYIVPEKLGDTDFNFSTFANSTPRNLKPLSGYHKPIPNSRLKYAGWKNRKNSDVVTTVEPDEWIDLDTGEILNKSAARKRGAMALPSVSLRMITMCVIFRQCPPTKRDFLSYILKLRNSHGGLVADLKSILDKWIERKHPNIDSTDKARKRKALENFLYKYGILMNNQTFTTELQFISKTSKADNVREAARFVTVLPVRGRPGRGFNSRQHPV
jgi:hypothetical protein